MKWYTGMCGSNGHGFTIQVSFMVNACVCEDFLSNGFVTNDVAISNGWSL
jgi:hypothetical protein